MKVSVITVCYNAAETLPEALSSVAEQSHPDVEHIVVDGGSTDNTSNVLKQFGGHVHKFISEPDRGIYDAMNKGLALADGDVIGFLNADDVYANADVISKVTQAMASGGLDALLGDAAYFRPGKSKRFVRRYHSSRFSPALIGWGWMPAHPALFIRGAVYSRSGGFRTDYRIAGDFEFVARIFKSGQLSYRHLPEVLVHMRTGGVSTAGWRNSLLLNREVMRACRENGINTNMLKIITKYPWKLVELLRT